MMIKQSILGIAAGASLLSGVATAEEKPVKPNILYIMLDDLGKDPSFLSVL